MARDGQRKDVRGFEMKIGMIIFLCLFWVFGQSSYVMGAENGSKTVILLSANSIIADGKSNITVTVQARDASGNPLKAGNAKVTLAATAGTVGKVNDNANGTYTAVLTSSTVSGDVTINGTINGQRIAESKMVTFVPGPADSKTSKLIIKSNNVVADGNSLMQLDIQLADSNKNHLTRGGDVVQLFTNQANIGKITDNQNGTYTATLTSTISGKRTVIAAINGRIIAEPITVNFLPGSVAINSSHIIVSQSSASADGKTAIKVTLQLKDIHNNNLTNGGASVVLGVDHGTLSNVHDNGDGTYTAFLTSTEVGFVLITGKVNGQMIPDNQTVNFTAVNPVTPNSTNGK